MSKLIRASIALAALTSFVAVPSVASASPELTTGTKAPAGLAIQATNVAHEGSSKHAVLTTSTGNITCEEATVTGTLISNTGTHIEGEITTISFGGSKGSPHCTGPSGNYTITPSHSSNPAHSGISSLPWCVTANALNDQFTVRGGKCSEAARSITWSFHTLALGTCFYQRASLTGSLTTHTGIVTLSGQEFTKVTGSAFCPSTGQLDMAFTLETDSEKPLPLFIS